MDILHAAGEALFIVLDPSRLSFLFLGVCMGLALGILPGIGGIAGTALLLPFTYAMDPPTAMALLLGLGATTTTADPISAIVLGAPGHAAFPPLPPTAAPAGASPASRPRSSGSRSPPLCA